MAPGLIQYAINPDREFSDRIRMLYNNTPIVLIGVPVAALVMVWFFWDTQKYVILSGWLAANIFLSFIRAVVYRIYMQGKFLSDRPLAWARIYTAFAFLSGVIWGIFPWLILDVTSTYNVLVIMLVLFGMVAGSIASHAPVFSTYVAFSLPTVVLLAARLAIEGDDYYVLCVLLVAFLLVNLGYAWNQRKMFIEVIQQKFKNELLLVDLQKKKEEAEKANQDKSRFLASTSHDLRQPLHALDLFLGSLSERLSSGAEIDLVKNAKNSSRALKELLDALLDISRLDAGDVYAKKVVFPIAPLLEECMEEVAPIATEKGLKLRLRPVHKGCVNSDPVLLRRMIRNILSNAIRYTDQGGILVGVRSRAKNMIIEVWDTGKGIPEHAQQHIFDEFYQLDNPERDREKGLGLGLAILCKLSKLLDHPVSVVSKQGRGSCFRISLACCEAAKDCSPSIPEADIHESITGMSVMVIEDNQAVLTAMRTLLRGWGCEVFLSQGTDEALDELARHEYAPPDVIMADYRLRGSETGIDAINRIKDYFGREIPAILISGESTVNVEKEAQDIHAKFLRKPVESQLMKQTLAEVVAAAEHRDV